MSLNGAHTVFYSSQLLLEVFLLFSQDQAGLCYRECLKAQRNLISYAQTIPDPGCNGSDVWST